MQTGNDEVLADYEPKSGRSWKSLLSIAGTFVAAFGTFGFFAIQGILLARLLGPEGRGAFATIVSYPQLLLYMGLLGAAEIFARCGAKCPEGDNDSAIRCAAMQYGLTTGSVIAALAVALAWFAIPEDKRHLAPLAMLAAMSLPLQHIRLSVQGVDHGAGHFNRYNTVRISAAAFFPILLVGLWACGIDGLREITMAFLLACAAGLLLCQWGMQGSWLQPASQSLSTSLRSGKGLAVSQIVAELLDRADVFLILWLGTLAEQGFYASAVPIAATMIIVPNAIGLYSFRRGAGEQKPLGTKGVTKLLGLVIVCQAIFGTVLAIVIPIAIPILYGEAFNATIDFAWCLMPAAAIRGTLMATDTYLRGRGKPRPGIAGRIVALVVLIILTVVGHQHLGIWIIPAAFGAAQLTCLIVVVVAMYRDAQQIKNAEAALA